MQLVDRNILIISPEPWDHIFVSKHHYAVHLAKRRNNVFFLNPPSSKSDTKSDRGVTIVDYKGFLKGMAFLPKFLRLTITRRVYRSVEIVCQKSFDIIWSFDNSVFYDFDALPKKVLKISHTVDLNQDFQTKRASKSADVCFGVIDDIVSRALLCNVNSYKVGHGLNIPASDVIPLILPGKNKKKALYIGNLAMKYLDWKIVYQAISLNSSVDFIFVGPQRKNIDLNINPFHNYKKLILNLPNAYFLPKVSSDEIPNYLMSSDALILSYQQARHKDQANSHKVLEYLASGKPIVATYTSEYDGSNLLYMSKLNSEWPELFKKVIQNLPKYSNPELTKKRRTHALNNTYIKQIDRIEQILASLQL